MSDELRNELQRYADEGLILHPAHLRDLLARHPAALAEQPRCKITGNECGTDTWIVGQPCQCENCQAYLAEKPVERPAGEWLTFLAAEKAACFLAFEGITVNKQLKAALQRHIRRELRDAAMSNRAKRPQLSAERFESRLSAMLYRSLERLHLAVKGCAKIGFQESTPTTNAHHASIWQDLNEAQKDAELKLKHYAAPCAERPADRHYVMGNDCTGDQDCQHVCAERPQLSAEQRAVLMELVQASETFEESLMSNWNTLPRTQLSTATKAAAAAIRALAQPAQTVSGDAKETK